MQLQKLYSLTRQAIEQQYMISAGDRVADGLSGGKDSIALLYAMSGLSKFYSKPFELEAITVDLGFGMDFSTLELICDRLKIRYHVISTDIKEIVFDLRKENNPCSLCANLRKGALNAKAVELGCNKIAYAHHKDDVVETMLMSLIFEGRFHTFSPVTYWDRMDLTLIRPMIFMEEMDVIGFQHKYNLPVVKSRCPVDGLTKRQDAKDLVKELNQKYPGCKNRMFTAILNGNIPGWPDITK